jgi:hypothetical protein
MASYNKFHCYTQDLHEAKHNLPSDILKIALTPTEPLPSHQTLSDVDEISAIGGYSVGGISLPQSTSIQVNGVYKLNVQDVTFTASGDMEPFRYIVIYNSSSSQKNLICWYDHGSLVTLKSGESYFFDFDQEAGVFSLS